MKRRFVTLLVVAFAVALPVARAADALPGPAMPLTPVATQVAAHPGQSGYYVLDSAAEALVARAWLTGQARRSIDVQYFIWSTDNIGILAAEALLAAAERGVQVRVIVDDLMIDAPDKSLLALARHPRVDIRIYNPKTSVGQPLHRKAVNVATDFRGVNQRMHNKVVVVDGEVAITGGRNMAAEYYDYNHRFNFRDRDVLLMGEAVKQMSESFEHFWSSELSVPVEKLYGGLGILTAGVRVDGEEIQSIYRGLREYARAPDNFSPEVRAAIEAAPTAFERLAAETRWGRADYVSDRPGKNDGSERLGGGGALTTALARQVDSARERVVVQSPYLVMSEPAQALFRGLARRGVKVRISTNSLASTDNLPAFSGYRNQRAALLGMGLEIFEYRPDARSQRARATGVAAAQVSTPPVLGLHAKTLVVDSKVVFIGTFNFDPRSENLNTEGGVFIHDEALARAVEAAIEVDMQPGNSWSAARDDPDQHVSFGKRTQVRFLQLMPIKPVL